LYVFIGICWVAWGIIFFLVFRNSGKHEMLKGIITILITGSLLELIPAVFMHFVASKRGCFGGIFTSFGVSIGIVVMLWAFGPGIIFLFMHAKYKAELRKSADRVQYSPEPAEETKQTPPQ
jgi:hypothetical protein